MSVRRILLGLVLAVATGGTGWAAPLEAYGQLPSIESVEISPDGGRIALVVSTAESRLLAVRSLSDAQVQTYAVGAAKVRRLDWVGSERLIISSSQTAQIANLIAPRREYLMGFDLDLTARKLKPLLERVAGGLQVGTHIRDRNSERVSAALNVLAGPPQVRVLDGKPTLFLRGITFPDNRGVLTQFRINPRNGASDIVELGERYTDDFVLGADGTVVAKSDYDAQTGRWSLKLRKGSSWIVSRTLEAKTDAPFLAGLGRDGASIVVGQSGETGLVLQEVNAEGWGEPLAARDANSLIFDPATHRLIGLYALVGDEARYTFFDPANQKAWNAVRAAFKGDQVQLESWSQDRSKIVVLVDSPTLGPAYALVDLAAKRAVWLGGRYQQLRPQDVAPVRPIRFKAADGLDLSGYLTTPNGREAKNLPLIVFPHGGPASRDAPGFDWWAQAMASRGYAVLQVNFRGSDGFTADFLEAGFGEWGGKMQTDLSDGVRHLAAQGVIDPKRVCIVGASYGGYAALAGAAIDRGVYRCAASYGGVSDLKRMVSWSKARSIAAFRYWIRFMGAESGRDEILTARSPSARAGSVDIPLLLIHGKDDTVVPLEQSQLMADAMRKAGKPVELLVMKGEDHWLSRGETRQQMLAATMAFVEKHNPPN